MKAEKGKSILSVIFVIWLLVSVGLLIYYATTSEEEDNSGEILVLFGQIFGVIGIIVCYQFAKGKELLENMLLLLVPTTGLLCIYYGMLEIADREGSFRVLYTAMILLGAVITGSGVYMKIRIRMHCTYTISARIAKLHTKVSRVNNKTKLFYCPVYEIRYNGRQYELFNQCYSRTKFKVGSYEEIQINPHNPTEFRDKNSSPKAMMQAVIGLILLALGLYLYIISSNRT